MIFQKGKKYNVIAKEWFDRTYGNSYFSAKVYDLDSVLLTLPFQYGYGDYYLQAAKEELSKLFENGEDVLSCRYSELFGIQDKTTTIKRDVVNFGK